MQRAGFQFAVQRHYATVIAASKYNMTTTLPDNSESHTL